MEDLKNQYLAWDWNTYVALDQRITRFTLKTHFLVCHVLSFFILFLVISVSDWYIFFATYFCILKVYINHP